MSGRCFVVQLAVVLRFPAVRYSECIVLVVSLYPHSSRFALVIRVGWTASGHL